MESWLNCCIPFACPVLAFGPGSLELWLYYKQPYAGELGSVGCPCLRSEWSVNAGGRGVGCSIVETFSKDVRPRELEEVLRLEYRSKLLNPKWAQVERTCWPWEDSSAHVKGDGVSDGLATCRRWPTRARGARLRSRSG